MSDSEDQKDSPAIPSWQRGAQSEESPTVATEPQDDKLEVARRFLDDESVKDASRQKKVEFLKSKDIAGDEIQKLLGEEEAAASVVHGDGPEAIQPQTESSASSETTETSDDLTEIVPSVPPTTTAPTPATSISSSPPPQTASLTPQNDRAPIVTYPEFLAKPARPPPLVTTNALFNTLYAFAGLSSIIYGCSKYIVAPMVQTQTEARQDLHAATAARLESIVTKLEGTVSEIPPRKSMTVAEETPSEAEDPTEMFHRDMGTQTSPMLTPSINDGKEPTSKKHTGQLESISKRLTDLKNEVRAQSEDMEDIKTLVDTFRDELDSMTYPNQGEYLSGYDLYGRSKKQDPDDEIKKVRDNIRRVKGVLLSTRNFPASTR